VGQLRLNSAGKIEVYVDVVLKGTSTKILQTAPSIESSFHIVYGPRRGKAPAPDYDSAINQIEFSGYPGRIVSQYY